MSVGIPVLNPLLCRIPLLPGESLFSYLARLATANCYPSSSMFTKLCNQYLAAFDLQDDPAYPQHPETFDALASLTHLSPQELANASIHHFANSPILSVVEDFKGCLSDGTFFQALSKPLRSKYLWRVDHVKFCPDCLQGAAYHRLVWMLKDTLGCLKHQCLLTDRCQNCLAWVNIQDIIRCQCGTCGTNLAKMATGSMDTFGLFVQRNIHLWWGLDTPPANAKGPTPTLPEQPPHILYQLFERFGNSVEASQLSDEQSDQIVPGQYRTQLLAFKILVDWPTGFHDFLRQELEWEVKVHSYYHYCDFSAPVYLRNNSTLAFWICRSQSFSEFDFIRSAVENFLAANHITIQIDHWGTRTYVHICIDADESLQKIARPIAERTWKRISAAIEL